MDDVKFLNKEKSSEYNIMENEIGIGVGIKVKGITRWYAAHSLNRRSDGAMEIFARDENRTSFVVPAKDFSGVAPGIRGLWSKEPLTEIHLADAMQNRRDVNFLNEGNRASIKS